MNSIQNFTVPSAPVQTAERKPVNFGNTEDKKSGFRQMLESKQEEKPDSEQLQIEETKQNDAKNPELEQLAAMQMLGFQPVILPTQPEIAGQTCIEAEVLQVAGQENTGNVFSGQSPEMMQISRVVSENASIGQEHSEIKDSAFAGLGQAAAQAVTSEKESTAVLTQETSVKTDSMLLAENAEQQVQHDTGNQNMSVQKADAQANSVQQMQDGNQSGISFEQVDAGMRQPQAAEQFEKLPQDRDVLTVDQSAMQDETAIKVSETPEAERKSSVAAPEKQVLQQVESLIKSGDRKITMQLEPHNLGKIRIELVQKENGSLHVVLHAEHKEVQKLLEQHLPEMQQLLRSDSHQEVQIQVPTQQEHEQQELYDQQQSGRQNQQNPEQQHKQEHKRDFLNQLRLGLLSEEA